MKRGHFGICHACGNAYRRKGGQSQRVLLCLRCASAHSSRGTAAHMLVKAAVTKGRLVPVTSLTCVDCGVTASVYEHRDYLAPLDVVPVCSRCNWRRGHTGVAAA